jgi:hypothetical protein
MSATPSITMQPVTSSQIAAIGHAPELNLLAIQFPPKKSTGVADTYHYQGVDAAMFAEFLAAESQGSFFIQRIKKFPDLFPYEKLDPAAAPAPVDTAAEKLAADHAEALAFHERFYIPQMEAGVHYSGSKFKENSDPVMLNADGSRNIFCDVDE